MVMLLRLARRTAPQIEKASLFYADERDESAEEVGDAAVVLLLRRRRSRDVDDDLPHRSREDEAMLGKLSLSLGLGRAHRRRGDRLRDRLRDRGGDRGGDRGFGGGHGERLVCGAARGLVGAA